ncbi:MAG: hypothetical protein HOA57_01565 [Candidatus Magasanikbacteria bacterium]|jgi:hypothetical protein|nr:hypothetical protein [Candidatus Magasanikbacteria bacterium]MBT4315189.1 hypothetical protein [Candidatus Magasanikbacteria bacterium]MBT4547354.1 hypothetical protein [Candidatus Magasanikbacteria bacterium]MBT6819044.1 hypothetical protein [Candidatus Magasanikbacteria bacterium]
MKIWHLLVVVMFSCFIVSTPLAQGKTSSLEQVITKAETMWGGVITVDFSVSPPSVMAVPVSMLEIRETTLLSSFSYGEELRLVDETSTYYAFSMPENCGDTHVLARVLVLKTGNTQDVGFEMKPIGGRGCVLVPRGKWYDNQPVRTLTNGREAYRFFIQEDLQMLLNPNMEKCEGIIPHD